MSNHKEQPPVVTYPPAQQQQQPEQPQQQPQQQYPAYQYQQQHVGPVVQGTMIQGDIHHAYPGSLHQPQYHHSGVPVGTVPYSTSMPGQPDFSTGLCDCGNDPASMWLDSTFCHYCTVGYQYEMIHNHRFGMNPFMCMAPLIADIFCTGGLAMLTVLTMLRGDVRRRYSINGDACTDCIMSAFCTPCTICQITREMTLHGAFPGGVFTTMPPTVQVGYSQNIQ
eukprot:PhM_4_TR7924/c0_g1_i1/m.41294